MKDASVYLKHIQDAIARIESYTAQGRKGFFENIMVQDAVIRNLEVIGEAVKPLPEDLRQRYPQIPWRSITASVTSSFTSTLVWTSRSYGVLSRNGCPP